MFCFCFLVISNIVGGWVRVKKGLLADVIARQLLCVNLDYLNVQQ